MMKTITASLACLMVPGISNAALILNSTGLTAPATTVTFSEITLSGGTVVTDQFSGYGVEFGALSPNDGLYYTSAGSSGAGLQNYFPDVGYVRIKVIWEVEFLYCCCAVSRRKRLAQLRRE